MVGTSAEIARRSPSIKIRKSVIRRAQKKRDLERLLVAANGGVANTVVFLKDISKGKAMDLPEEHQFLNQKTCRYEPHVLLVPTDGTLQIKSSDPVLHTVHMSGASDYNLPFPFANQTVSRTMNRERSCRFALQCGPCLDECRNVGGDAIPITR